MGFVRVRVTGSPHLRNLLGCLMFGPKDHGIMFSLGSMCRLSPVWGLSLGIGNIVEYLGLANFPITNWPNHQVEL